MKPKIILASASPRRSGLLQQIGLEFEVIPANIKEDININISHEELVKKLAEEKAENVAKRLKEGIVIGADTIFVLGKERIGKPKNKKDAIRVLKRMSGKMQEVYSGVAIINAKTGKKVVDSEITKIKVRKLSDEEIEHYVNTGEPLDKAGAIAIQGLGAIFVSKIDGCSSNVVGLPLYNLYKNLKKFGVNLFEFEKWKNYIK